ncbi:MAG: dienelactone hydrolase family protein [Fimbriimonadaceae bacterium]
MDATTHLTLTILVAVLLAACGCNPAKDALTAHSGDSDFHAAHTLSDKPVTGLRGEEVRFEVDGDPNGGRGYWVATEEDPDRVVVVIHEWWGLNDYVRKVADEYAAAIGGAALAIDLYEGKVATDAAQAGEYMRAVDTDRANKVVQGALAVLRNGGLAKDAKLATVGFCFGGGWSHRTAILGGDAVKACVIYYGQPVTDQGELAKLRAPVLMVWPTKDQWINKAMVDGFKEAMEKAGKTLTVEAYEADHAFSNPSSKAYDNEDAKDAFAKATGFMKSALGGS